MTMPKCRAYVDGHDGDSKCLNSYICTERVQPDCRAHGWLPFWAPAERAGLKAMGRQVKSCLEMQEPVLAMTTWEAIRTYVESARAVKGAK